MSTMLSKRTVTARKPHLCECCGVVAVQPGDTYKRTTYVTDGRIYDWVSCTGCSAAFWTVWDWAGEPEEGIGMDTYDEWARDQQCEPTTAGEQARAYLKRRSADA